MNPNTIGRAAIKRRNLVSPYSPEAPSLDALRIRRILQAVGGSIELAAVRAELAFPQVDSWRGAR